MITLAVHPARQLHPLADMVGPQLGAMVGAIGVHHFLM
jgi:hypothetical protein